MNSAEIIRIRHELGLTQEQLAHAVGVTTSTVNRWEMGHSRPHRIFFREVEKLLAIRLAAAENARAGK
jgi:putative transcriptional regulator